jgi:hypothetical protein
VSNRKRLGVWAGKRIPDYAATSRHRARRGALPRSRVPDPPAAYTAASAQRISALSSWLRLPGRQGQR